MYQLNQVEAVLKYGKAGYGLRWIVVLVCCIIEYVCSLVGIVAGIIALALHALDKSDIVAFVFLVIFCLVMSGVCTACLVFIAKRKKEVTSWLADAVACPARVNRLDLDGTQQVGTVEVLFGWNGQQMRRVSPKRNFFLDNFSAFYKYAMLTQQNQPVYILYSPKYDQVMFLNMNKVNPQILQDNQAASTSENDATQSHDEGENISQNVDEKDAK